MMTTQSLYRLDTLLSLLVVLLLLKQNLQWLLNQRSEYNNVISAPTMESLVWQVLCLCFDPVWLVLHKMYLF